MQEQARNTRVLVAAITNPNTTMTMKLCFVMPFYDYSSAQIRTYGLAFHNFYDTPRITITKTIQIILKRKGEKAQGLATQS